ncbi:flagellar hook-length control protein FliK [Gorillibacterium timonense]|uniref:flagellar hook-length control protein FliK n=1 Tax=Gorillibacterium timonense TaxID=1689269 RepID=UPI00071D88EF|nr:flagellar hook-length control protein FliK [Gorillibacterium timonense]
MEIVSSTPVPAANAGTAQVANSGKGTATASTASSTDGSKASQSSGKTAFKDVLNQVNTVGTTSDQEAGSDKVQESTDSAGTTLQALLDPLLMALLLAPSTQQSPPSQEDLKKLIEAVLNQPEEISTLMQTEDGQAWLGQAQVLLQAMGYLPAASNQTDSGTDALLTADQSIAPPNQAVNPEEILKGLLTAMTQEPESALPAQMAESFARLLASEGSKTEGSSTVSKPVSDTSVSESLLTPSGNVNRSDIQIIAKSGKATHSAASLEALTFRKGLSAEQAQALAAAMREGDEDSKSSSVLVSALSGHTEEAASTTTAAPQQAATKTIGESAEDVAPIGSQPVVTEISKTLSDPVKSAKPEFPVNVKNFAEEVSSLLFKNSKLGNLGTLTEARLLLRPEHLGAVDVRITLQNGQLVAHFAAQQSLAKDVLENQMAQLRVNLQNQGYQVERLEVTHSPSLQSGMFHGDQGRQFRQSNGNGQESRSGAAGQQEEEFDASLMNTEQIRRAVAGATVDYTA